MSRAGYAWSSLPDDERLAALRALDDAGLSVLSVSRHGADEDSNAAIMHLRTESARLAETFARGGKWKQLQLRWVCVLQTGGVENRASLERYMDWAASTGVREICFKELYVSTSTESVYHDRKSNEWSAAHQVPLRLILDFAREHGWREVSQLPWGAPLFEGEWRGRPMRIAAYTEPSLYWERVNGLCRSWNLMADGTTYASLEDKHSVVFSRSKPLRSA